MSSFPRANRRCCIACLRSREFGGADHGVGLRMTPMKTRHAEIPVYITKDGSEIRELMHPAVHGNRLQSLAEATVHPGQRTHLHRHARTEELYHVTSGAA
jgi:hypothetical protein